MFLHFYAKIQDGRQNWHENDFSKKSLVDSADTLSGQKFRSTSHRFRDKCVFVLTQKFKMVAKSVRKIIFAKRCQYTLQTLCGL